MSDEQRSPGVGALALAQATSHQARARPAPRRPGRGVTEPIDDLITARIAPSRPPTPTGPSAETPPPIYVSWDDYVARTTPLERRAWCLTKAKRANRVHLMSNAVEKLTVQDVVDVLDAARGRCIHCGSLAVERRPSAPNGAPALWTPVGRRVGSLEHVVSLVLGGRNHISNLAWSCLWCNTWPSERTWAATDHGAVPPTDDRQRP